MKRKIIFLLLVLLVLSGCTKTPVECIDSHIQIENRWYEENGGIDYLELKNKKDISFICNRIKNFPEGKEVRVAYNHGSIDLYLNDKKVEAIFTYRNGIVYRVGIGKYVYDEELTKHIMKLMKISNRCWGQGCKS